MGLTWVVGEQDLWNLAADIERVMAAHDRPKGYPARRIELELGRRYATLTAVETGSGRAKFTYGHVDLTNGNILMSAGRFGPDPIPRGNLFDASDPSGTPGRSCLGAYGVRYLADLMAEPATAAMVERLRARFAQRPGSSSPIPAPGGQGSRKVARKWLRIARWTPAGAATPGPWHLFEAYEVNSGHYETLCGRRPSDAETPSLSAVGRAPAQSSASECADCRRANREPGAS